MERHRVNLDRLSTGAKREPAAAERDRDGSVELELTRALAGSRSLADAAPRVLRGLGECVGGQVAELWRFSLDRKTLHRVATWIAPELRPTPEERLALETAPAPRPRGAGAAWCDGVPLWCPDLDADPAMAALLGPVQAGLRAVLAWPIGMHLPLGGFLFRGRELAEPDGRRQRLLDYTAGQLAQFLERLPAEEALRTSEERIRTVVNTAPVMLFALDARGTITVSEGQALQALGLAPGELVGRSVLEAYAHNPIASAEIRRALAGESFTGIVEEAGLVLETRWTANHGPDGSLVGVSGVVVDVTSSRRAESALVQSEERLRYVTMATRDAIYDWDVRHGRVWCNETYQALYASIAPALDDERAWKQQLHPDDRQRVVESIETAFRERSSSWSGEYRFLRRDGRYAAVINRGYVLYDRDGRPTRMIGAITDVSERTLAEAFRDGQVRVLEVIAVDAPLEEILLTLTRFIEAQSEGLSCSVLLLDEDGVHIRHGAAPSLPPAYVKALDGAAIGPRRGSCGAAMYENRTVIVTDVLVDPLWDEHRDLALEHGFRACWSIPIADHHGKVLGSFAMYCNQPRTPTRTELQLIEVASRLGSIALERKRASEQLRASLQEKDVLLKEIHHRVKNNLQIINSLLALQAEQLGEPRVLEAFAESQNRVRTMALVHEALYHSGDLAHVRFAAHVESLCAHLFRSYSTPARIHLEVDVADVALDLDGAIPCGLIINELVSNALKHGFPGERAGRVLVRFESLPQGEYALTVADDGVGLGEDIDPYRGETLGMQLVADLTEQLGGTLTLARERGTAFTVRFAELRKEPPP